MATLLSSLFLLFSLMSFSFHIHSRAEPSIKQAVVVDAGSTGTRAYLFNFTYNPVILAEPEGKAEETRKEIVLYTCSNLICSPFNASSTGSSVSPSSKQPNSSNSTPSSSPPSSSPPSSTNPPLFSANFTHTPPSLFKSFKVKPGISDVMISSIPTYLLELKEFIFNAIPEKERKHTFLVFRGTAGMRNLQEKELRVLQDEIATELDNWGLLFDRRWGVAVLDGETEGILGWAAANLLVNREENRAFDGLIEVGGGSAQIVLEKSSLNLSNELLEALNPEDIKDVAINGKTLQLYVKSYHGLGREFALKKHLQGLASEQDDEVLKASCLHEGVNFTLENVEDTTAYPFGRSVQGSADYARCQHKVRNELTKANHPATPFGIPEGLKLIVTENYYFFNEFVVKSPNEGFMNAKQFKDKAAELCRLSYLEVKESIHEEAADEKAQTACFGLIYLAELLTGVFKLEEDHILQATNQIDGIDIIWPLGFILAFFPELMESVSPVDSLKPSGLSLPLGTPLFEGSRSFFQNVFTSIASLLKVQLPNEL